MSVEFILQQRVHKEIYWQSSVPFYKKQVIQYGGTGYSIREYDAGIGIFKMQFDTIKRIKRK